MYEERLIDGTIEFLPKIDKISKLPQHFGHKEINANGDKVLTIDYEDLKIAHEIDFVFINNNKYSLKLK